MPAFFAGYAGPVLPVWLESLSQASNGEYAADAATPVAVYTDAVREALASHRLLLANHALLLAHLDDLDALGSDTLLIIDEAHQLEDAATSALTKTVDYRAVEDLFAELEVWAATARPGAERDSVRYGNREPRHPARPRASAQGCRDGVRRAGTGAGVVVGSRTVTLASPYSGTAGVAQVRQLAALLLRLGGQCEALVGAFGAYWQAHEARLDFFELERVKALWPGAPRSRSRLTPSLTDMNAIIGPASGPADARGMASDGCRPEASDSASTLDGQAEEDPDGELLLEADDDELRERCRRGANRRGRPGNRAA